MAGHRLEKVTRDGVYHCTLTPDKKGRNLIGDINWRIDWDRPIPSDGTLMSKMVDECHLHGEKLIRRGIIPMSIHSVGLEDLRATCTTHEEDERPYEYFAVMNLLGNDYSIDWRIEPEIPDRNMVAKILRESSATEGRFTNRYGMRPRRITAFSRMGSREVYTLAE